MKKTVITRLDIRPRIIALLFLSILFFLPLKPAFTAALAGAIIIFSLAVDGPGATATALGRIMPVLILVVLLTPLFTRGGGAVISVNGRVLVTREGLDEIMRMAARFSGITLLFALFYHSTKEDELINGFGWFGLPFRGALVINLSLRFIPEMFVLYRRVKDAHSLRDPGGESRKGLKRVMDRFGRTLPHLTSVLILSLKKIAPLSMSLHLRGGDISKGRGVLNPLPRGKRVFFQFAGLFLCICAIIIALVTHPGVMV